MLLFTTIVAVAMTLLPGPGFVIGHWTIDNWEIDGPLNGHAPVRDKCQAFFNQYSEYAGEFSRCELQYAQPFRMCEMCVEKYFITTTTYYDLSTDSDLEVCRVKYMKSDRVQIFPHVQNNMEDIWKQAACSECFENLAINHTTKKVSYDIPEAFTIFQELYSNLSICMNTTLEDNEGIPGDGKIDVCTVCLDNYTALNNHYNDISSQANGDVCMDIVDRMNHTRLIWSHTFDCSYRSSDPAAVIVIAIIIASFPFFFYIIIGFTAKEKKKKISKQKRLNYSIRSGNTNSSMQQSLWRPNNYNNYHSLSET